MKPDDNHSMDDVISEISAALKRAGDEAGSTVPIEVAVREWLDAGFDDPEEVSDWLAARCFKAASAQALDAAGITAEQAALRTTQGAKDYEETIAFKFTRGDLTIAEARRIVTNDFWNT